MAEPFTHAMTNYHDDGEQVLPHSIYQFLIRMMERTFVLIYNPKQTIHKGIAVSGYVMLSADFVGKGQDSVTS